jgi:hypothetical protein
MFCLFVLVLKEKWFPLNLTVQDEIILVNKLNTQDTFFVGNITAYFHYQQQCNIHPVFLTLL